MEEKLKKLNIPQEYLDDIVGDYYIEEDDLNDYKFIQEVAKELGYNLTIKEAEALHDLMSYNHQAEFIGVDRRNVIEAINNVSKGNPYYLVGEDIYHTKNKRY